MHCSIRPPVSCGIFPLVKSNRNQKTLELRWNDLLVVKQGKAQWVVRVNVFVCMCACAYVLQEPEDTQTPAILLIAYFYVVTVFREGEYAFQGHKSGPQIPGTWNHLRVLPSGPCGRLKWVHPHPLPWSGTAPAPEGLVVLIYELIYEFMNLVLFSYIS